MRRCLLLSAGLALLLITSVLIGSTPRPPTADPLATPLTAAPATPSSGTSSSGTAASLLPRAAHSRPPHTARPVQPHAAQPHPRQPLPSLAFNERVPVEVKLRWVGRVKVAVLIGGRPVSRHVLWRSSVGEFVRQAGAVAGINGTFFKDAALRSNDSNMLGPMLTAGGQFLSETDPAQLRKIGGRPLVTWSPERFLVTPFVPGQMNRKAQLRALLPGATDAFVAGAWLVHGGVAFTTAQMKRRAPGDAQEVRPRVFFGITSDGRSIAGATLTPVSSARLALVAQAAGACEAVLLDSGYSTSLIYGPRVLAVGHQTRKVPSRPVPHAIVFLNPLLAQLKVAPKGSN